MCRKAARRTRILEVGEILRSRGYAVGNWKRFLVVTAIVAGVLMSCGSGKLDIFKIGDGSTGKNIPRTDAPFALTDVTPTSIVYTANSGTVVTTILVTCIGAQDQIYAEGILRNNGSPWLRFYTDPPYYIPFIGRYEWPVKFTLDVNTTHMSPGDIGTIEFRAFSTVESKWSNTVTIPYTVQ